MHPFPCVRFVFVFAAAICLLASCDSGSNSSNADTNSSGNSGSTIPWNSSVSYGSLTYGGQTYKTVAIGTQIWMAENLNYAVDSSWWYNGSADSGAKYGRLYTWASAMKLPDSCNRIACASQVQSKHQGVCPSGWHVPSDTEWTILATYVGGAGTAGTKLKSTSGWLWNGEPDNATDTYGFRALPAGGRYDDGSFSVSSDACFWSSSEFDGDRTLSRFLFTAYDGMNSYFGKDEGYSVRCLKD
jgi:uncharacterized protein (TIGR02145 family)